MMARAVALAMEVAGVESSLSAAESPAGAHCWAACGFAGPGSGPGGHVATETPTAEQIDGEGKKAATQARILRAARSLFAARGYERTTIAAIASEAQVSRAAVFWHFGDKAKLFQEACRELLIPFFQEVGRSIDSVDPGERMLLLCSVYDEFVEKNRETIEIFVRWVMESPSLRESLQKQLFELHDQFARDMRSALAGALGDASQSSSMAAALVALLDGNLLLSFLDPDPESRRLRLEGLHAIIALVLGRQKRS